MTISGRTGQSLRIEEERGYSVAPTCRLQFSFLSFHPCKLQVNTDKYLNVRNMYAGT